MSKSSSEIPIELLLGQRSELMDTSLGKPVHPEIVTPFRALQSNAADAGFDMQIISGFRDFDRQRAIWNAKASGQRTLLDSAGAVLDFAALSESQLVDVILRWSALPGASRHHWGTDIDIYDAGAVPADYDVQLTPQEVEGDGPFAAMHNWLDEQFQAGLGQGFFRPYDVDRGGIAPERWHLSYAPLSFLYERSLRPGVLAEALDRADVCLKPQILARLMEIYQRYIAVPSAAYPEQFCLSVALQP
jgi:LAS superfamily LD-carboxypeptidase LdcB